MDDKLKKNCISHSIQAVEYILSRRVDELEDLTVEKVANAIKISRSQLWRIFKQDHKITIEAYLIRIKIEEAALLLRMIPNLTIKDIAKKIGYCRSDYFIRVFKKIYGTTPGRYRELKM